MKAAAEPSAKADRPGVGLACALTLAVFAFGLACQPRDDAAPAPPRSARAPGTPVSIGLELNGVIHSAAPPIVVPPSGFVINATWPRLEGAHARLRLFDARGATRELAHVLGLSGDGAGRIVPADQAFAVGPAQLVLEFEEASGTLHRDAIAFEVAEFPGARAPIGHGQWIWFDFTADRDATPGPDFEADLVAFGLLSPTASPGLRAHVRQRVIDTALDRVRSVYASSNPSRVDGADAVAVSFGEHDPRVTDTTRICVGGADPSGGTSIGHVKLDPGNRRRRETLCGPQPPARQ